MIEYWDIYNDKPLKEIAYLSANIRYWNGNELYAVHHFSMLDLIEKEMRRYWTENYFNSWINELEIARHGTAYGWWFKPHRDWLLGLKGLVNQHSLESSYLRRAEELMIDESMLWVKACC